jgi:hypothetical protein
LPKYVGVEKEYNVTQLVLSVNPSILQLYILSAFPSLPLYPNFQDLTAVGQAILIQKFELTPAVAHSPVDPPPLT